LVAAQLTRRIHHDRVVNDLLNEFLRQRTYQKTFCLKLLNLARDRKAGWGTRCLAILMAERTHLARPERLERRTRAFKRLGAVAGPFVDRARKLEGDYGRRLFSVFDDHDVLITPMTARPPVEVMRWEGMGAPRAIEGISRVYPYAAPWNVLGNPAAAVPALLDDDGLPVAVQLVARPNDEPTIVALAAQIEAERPWPERPPIAA